MHSLQSPSRNSQTRARGAAPRLLSPRVIITKVQATVRRIFSISKTKDPRRRKPTNDTFDEWVAVGHHSKEFDAWVNFSCHSGELHGKRDFGRCSRPAAIEKLPNEVLLEVFDTLRHLTLKSPSSSSVPWQWHRLTHVCRRWRSLIFASPHLLDLRLVYTYQKPVRKTLDLWPPLPVAICYPRLTPIRSLAPQDEENVIAALKHPTRVCEINLNMTRSLLSKSSPLMRVSFPELEHLRLRSQDAMRPLFLPTTFLAGSAPRLRDIHLDRTAYPTLPLLLLSTPDLVSLCLDEIPSAGYFPPEALVNGLSGATQLKSMKIHFLPPTSRPEHINSPLPPQNRILFPNLTELHFSGCGEFLEDLVSRMRAPALKQFNTTLFEQPTFEIPQLCQFIDLTEALRSPHQTSIRLSDDDISIIHEFQSPSVPSTTATTATPTSTLPPPSPPPYKFRLQLACDDLDRQTSMLVHVCQQLSSLLSNVERLDVEASPLLFIWRNPDETDAFQWLELFRQFKGVKKLDVSGTLVPSIAGALERVIGSGNDGLGGNSSAVQDLLPALCDLHLSGSTSTSSSLSIKPFLAARERSGNPISVYWGVDDDV
ncbi:hypothetical protein B0F90DRAFT_1920754 [Multifurca ochricompacta]|uniref:F-box domain-containing protein n=1 Tax=Multifurca ochricompacta TaxID=376703 RepID=A0AAD4LWQ2_9AGAM|nr:hypothetical protein B0F90DRAFT_1920754 [Multifurca ochricompacta]